MNIYIACALTHVPRSEFAVYSSFIHRLASAARQVNGVKDVKYALVNSDPQLAAKPFEDRAKLCYFWDRKMVEDADLVIADLTYPSTGLGIELQIAEAAGRSIIACFCDGLENRADAVVYENPDHSRHQLQIGEGYVSLMALGLPSICSLVRYSRPEDGVSRVVSALETLLRR